MLPTQLRCTRLPDATLSGQPQWAARSAAAEQEAALFLERQSPQLGQALPEPGMRWGTRLECGAGLWGGSWGGGRGDQIQFSRWALRLRAGQERKVGPSGGRGGPRRGVSRALVYFGPSGRTLVLSNTCFMLVFSERASERAEGGDEGRGMNGGDGNCLLARLLMKGIFLEEM